MVGAKGVMRTVAVTVTVAVAGTTESVTLARATAPRLRPQSEVLLDRLDSCLNGLFIEGSSFDAHLEVYFSYYNRPSLKNGLATTTAPLLRTRR
jgi:hypothetical protein